MYTESVLIKYVCMMLTKEFFKLGELWLGREREKEKEKKNNRLWTMPHKIKEESL